MIHIIKKLTKYGNIVLAFSIVSILMVLLFPIPTALLDFLLAFSIAVAFTILVTTLFIIRPLELSVFPTLLLVTTLLRLSLNIASTRLILSDGHKGSSAAGYVIEAFGGFVMQGNVVIGLIVFLILTLINFIVITKGSGRIAEVAARFSLDAMPGKQMAIDADLASGLISEGEAKSRRKNIEHESTFYGAMDGANKFVRGDAIAGLIITFINLIGGMIVGIVQKNLSFQVAVKTYAMLTIGDGLVTQIPSLIISLSAGLLVTKAGSNVSADQMIFGQLSKYPYALIITSIVTFMMSLLPGLPFIPFALISSCTGCIGYVINSLQGQKNKDQNGSLLEKDTNIDTKLTDAAPVANSKQLKKPTDLLNIDVIRLEIGYELIPLLNSGLQDQLKNLRKQIAEEYGFVIPTIKIQDNLQLAPDYYVIKIKEIESGHGIVRPHKLMVINPDNQSSIDIPGDNTVEPAFGLNAKWIDQDYKQEALYHNYTVIDSSTVIITHITEIIKDNMVDLLSYSETKKLLDAIEEYHPDLVKNTVPEIVSIAFFQKVLQRLLSEMISIRDLTTILESVAYSIKSNKNLTATIEDVRLQLSRQICVSNTNKEGVLPLITLSPEWEKLFITSLVDDGMGDKQISIQPSVLQDFIIKIKSTFDIQNKQGNNPVLITSSYTRPYIRSIIAKFRPSTNVISQNELYYKTQTITLASISMK